MGGTNLIGDHFGSSLPPALLQGCGRGGSGRRAWLIAMRVTPDACSDAGYQDTFACDSVCEVGRVICPEMTHHTFFNGC